MKRALVTGGSSPIGKAICHALARENLHIIVHAFRGAAEAESVTRAIRERGGSAETVIFDVTDTEATKQRIERLVEPNPIQILVHNAGIHADALMAAMSGRQWHDVISVSLGGFYNVTRPLLLPMMAARWGRIVAISSIAALMGNRGQANYAAAKAGLIGATRALSLECASRGITVNAVAPGVIASPAADKSFPAEKIKALVPMQRAGKPEEVADAVAFLASDRASYISGQTIAVNGGIP